MAIAKHIKDSMVKSSWIRKMFETGAKLKAEYGAENVFDFSLGNPDAPPPKEFENKLVELAKSKMDMKHSYMPNAGYTYVREAIATQISPDHGIALTGKDLIMTVGAGGALNVALKTVLNPGDTVLVSTPYFVEYNFYVSNHGGKLISIAGKEDFDLDIPAFEKAITKNTAAILINSPNNPSGAVYPESSVRALADLAKRKSKELGREIYIISDEPYRKIIYDGIFVPSILKYYSNSMVCTSYSKELSIPGERIGYIAVNPAAEDFSELINGLTLCNRILGYVNAPALMQRVIAELQGIQVDIEGYTRKRKLFVDMLTSIGYDLIPPKGTFYLFPKAPGGDDVQFVQRLQEEKILTVPGSGFGFPGHFRISYCIEDRVIEGSQKGFEKAFQSYQ